MTTMFQCKVPVVTSFIGGDIVIPWQRWISLATVCRTASKCLFVNRDMRRLAKMEDRGEVLPFGTDMQRFFPTNLDAARQRLGLNPGKRYILFSSTFDRVEKNLCLARQALELLSGQNIELLEFKLNFAEYELNDYFNACDLLLLTSHFEGSPQVVKEAMASCRPIVSTRVGDVEWLLGDTDGTYLSDHSPRSVADNIQQALDFQGPTRGRERLVDLGLDLGSVAKRLVSIYESVLSA